MLCAQVLLQAVHALTAGARTRALIKSRAARVASAELALAGLLLVLATRATTGFTTVIRVYTREK